jgi:hypothetical protein
MSPLMGSFGGGSARGFGRNFNPGSSGLYEFTNHTFTNAGVTGRTGPTLTQCRNAYSSVSWTQNNLFFNMTTQGIQEWTVPSTGNYRINAYGAKGGGNGGGNGARIQADFALIQGEIIKILVGQRGSLGSGRNGSFNSGGGGGGTFVIKSTFNTNASILVIASGGGGGNGEYGSPYDNVAGHPGQTSTIGGHTNSTGGGTNGSGGQSGNADHQASGGGGFFGNGLNGVSGTGGNSFTNNGIGGDQGSAGYNGGNGGFGGGGAGASNILARGGGGGGYSGGQGGSYAYTATTVYGDIPNRGYGGGGGSYNNGSNQTNSIGANADHGYVTITKL